MRLGDAANAVPGSKYGTHLPARKDEASHFGRRFDQRHRNAKAVSTTGIGASRGRDGLHANAATAHFGPGLRRHSSLRSMICKSQSHAPRVPLVSAGRGIPRGLPSDGQASPAFKEIPCALLVRPVCVYAT